MKTNWKTEARDEFGNATVARSPKTDTRFYRQRTGPANAPVWSKAWYTRKMINGESAIFSLGADIDKAAKIADLIGAYFIDPSAKIAEAVARFNPRALERPSAYSTIGEVQAVHSANISLLELKPQTARGYWNALINILRSTHAWRKGDEPASITGMPVNQLA